jgi:hypothetical protein
MQWFRLAAAQNHPLARHMLAFCLANGEGIEQNKNEAAELWRGHITTGSAYPKMRPKPTTLESMPPNWDTVMASISANGLPMSVMLVVNLHWGTIINTAAMYQLTFNRHYIYSIKQRIKIMHRHSVGLVAFISMVSMALKKTRQLP